MILPGTPRSIFPHPSHGQRSTQCLESGSRPHPAVPDFRGGLPLCSLLRRLSTSVKPAWGGGFVRGTAESAWMGSRVNIGGRSLSYSIAFPEEHLEAAAAPKEYPRRQRARGRAVSAWPAGTPSSSRRPCKKPPDLKINSALGIIAPLSQSRSNPELNPGLQPGGDAWGGPQCGTHTRPPHAAAFFYLQKKERKKSVTKGRALSA